MEKSFGGGSDYLTSAVSTTDYGFCLAELLSNKGGTKSENSIGFDYWIWKMDEKEFLINQELYTELRNRFNTSIKTQMTVTLF
jgi:hypothetical protein